MDVKLKTRVRKSRLAWDFVPIHDAAILELLSRAEVECKKKLVGKPGSVVDDHLSRRAIADTLQQPTRKS